jgi:NitT/TauT family transport system permease protein
MMKSSLRNKIEVFLSCIVLLLIWQFIAIKIDNDIYLPTIGQVLNNLYEILKEKYFFKNICSTMIRALLSFTLALFISILLGFLSYLSISFRNLIKPINTLVQSIPTMILVVLILIWFDKNMAPFIIGFFIVFPILYGCVLGALNNIDKNIIEMVNIYELRPIDKLIHLYIPSINIKLTPILVSTFSLALKVVIAGEIYGQPNYGIGSIIQVEKINFNTSAIFAWVLLIGIISIGLDYIQKYIDEYNYKWRKS